ncbi:MAG: hypothetical protein HeimC3_11630 [Candidatus Heimdallarchaeota archaeon LC_3]|nr:MAG: hypothetical protein HeimC3_11630 [Candidatus Heimdallarchaeota archaeon LC_3]
MQPKDMIIELRDLFKNYDYLSLSKRSKTNGLFCNWLSESISKLKDEVATVKNMVLQAQMIMVWGDLDKLLISLIDLGNVVNETSFDGTTFFRSTKQVIEDDDKLIRSDFKIVELMKEVLSKVAQFKDCIDSALLTETTQLVFDITDLLDKIIKVWGSRTKTILNFTYM